MNRLEPHYSSAAACLAEDPSALAVHPNYRCHLRIRLRSTNLLERFPGEVCRWIRVL